MIGDLGWQRARYQVRRHTLGDGGRGGEPRDHRTLGEPSQDDPSAGAAGRGGPEMGPGVPEPVDNRSGEGHPIAELVAGQIVHRVDVDGLGRRRRA